MVPQALMQLAQLPLTENGKIARQALPQPERAVREFVAARGEWENACLAVWRDLLQRQDIGVEDNFFSLGATLFWLFRPVIRSAGGWRVR